MDTTPAHEWIRLVSVEDCPPDRAKAVAVGSRHVAVFHLSGPDRFIVTPNACPHAGASLAAGTIEGNTITCFWHAWSFDLDTGTCTNAENVTLPRYESRIENGHVYARLPRMMPNTE